MWIKILTHFHCCNSDGRRIATVSVWNNNRTNKRGNLHEPFSLFYHLSLHLSTFISFFCSFSFIVYPFCQPICLYVCVYVFLFVYLSAYVWCTGVWIFNLSVGMSAVMSLFNLLIYCHASVLWYLSDVNNRVSIGRSMTSNG